MCIHMYPCIYKCMQVFVYGMCVIYVYICVPVCGISMYTQCSHVYKCIHVYVFAYGVCVYVRKSNEVMPCLTHRRKMDPPLLVNLGSVTDLRGGVE